MPAIKLVARLAMVMAISLVEHTVSSEAIAFSEADKVMSASALAPSPVVVGGQKGMMRSLRAEGAAIVRSEEERMPSSGAEVEGIVQAVEKIDASVGSKLAAETKLAAKTKWAAGTILAAETKLVAEAKLAAEAELAAEIEGLSEKLTVPQLKDAADDIESGGLSHTKTKSADDIDGQRPSHIETNPKYAFNWMDPMVDLAKAIPPIRPITKYDAKKNPVSLTHEVTTEDGQSILVTVPVTRPLMEDGYIDQVLLQLASVPLHDNFMEEWVYVDGLLQPSVEKLLGRHRRKAQAGKDLELFGTLYNARDENIRKAFPTFLLDGTVRKKLQEREVLEMAAAKGVDIELARYFNKLWLRQVVYGSYLLKLKAPNAAGMYYYHQFLYFCDFLKALKTDYPKVKFKPVDSQHVHV